MAELKCPQTRKVNIFQGWILLIYREYIFLWLSAAREKKCLMHTNLIKIAMSTRLRKPYLRKHRLLLFTLVVLSWISKAISSLCFPGFLPTPSSFNRLKSFLEFTLIMVRHVNMVPHYSSWTILIDDLLKDLLALNAFVSFVRFCLSSSNHFCQHFERCTCLESISHALSTIFWQTSAFHIGKLRHLPKVLKSRVHNQSPSLMLSSHPTPCSCSSILLHTLILAICV